uniref:Uncharacterized protein n=1 Tax=Anguilla anguilla TaxID=7936 RepID=A0A0E9QB67_ANGAN
MDQCREILLYPAITRLRSSRSFQGQSNTGVAQEQKGLCPGLAKVLISILSRICGTNLWENCSPEASSYQLKKSGANLRRMDKTHSPASVVDNYSRRLSKH